MDVALPCSLKQNSSECIYLRMLCFIVLITTAYVVLYQVYVAFAVSFEALVE